MKVVHSMEIEFDRYTVNPAGVRVEDKNGTACQVSGWDSNIVKKEIDRRGKVVIEVNYMEVTENGRLRQPTYKGIRL